MGEHSPPPVEPVKLASTRACTEAKLTELVSSAAAIPNELLRAKGSQHPIRPSKVAGRARLVITHRPRYPLPVNELFVLESVRSHPHREGTLAPHVVPRRTERARKTA